MIRMSKKFILRTMLFLLASDVVLAEKPWIIDPHTHFKGEEQIAYEATIKEWHPDNSLGKVVKPEDYRAVADRLGLRSTLVAVSYTHLTLPTIYSV